MYVYWNKTQLFAFFSKTLKAVLGVQGIYLFYKDPLSNAMMWIRMLMKHWNVNKLDTAAEELVKGDKYE